MNGLSLFTGIGGLDLGLERAGIRTIGQVEIDPFCRRVLAKHWPTVPRHDDVRTVVPWWRSEKRSDIDVIHGGFPCQDISNARTRNIRRGLGGLKSGLWNHFSTAIGELVPRWAIIENSSAWSRWVPFVRGYLYELGYSSLPIELSAGTFGAAHKRPRVFVVAHADIQGEPLRAIHAEVARIRPLPRRSDAHPLPRAMGMGDGIPDRMDRLHALGNAVVPSVAEWIGRQIVRLDAA